VVPILSTGEAEGALYYVMRNTAGALRFAESFLAIFDKAPDVAKPRIEEAKQRVERLRGGDVKKSKSP
jgi:hypothetical protein